MTSIIQRILSAISKFFSTFTPRHAETIAPETKLFVISDTHFNHRNIIKYAKRPFRSDRQMNNEILNRWNKVVGKNDIVFFLGDFSYHYRGKHHIGYWITHLNGQKVFIEGNHDVVKDNNGNVVYHMIRGAFHHGYLKYRGHEFCLIHDADEAPTGGSMWTIHGHSHQHQDFPFINGAKKRINVSIERIGYEPISLDKLIGLNYQTIQQMETINSRPIRMVA